MTDSPISPSDAPSHEPVRPDELLMRRVLPRKRDFDVRFTPPIRDGAFWPGPRDTDGLSLSRRRSDAFPHFVGEWEFKAACTFPDEKLREHCGVCAILAQAAREIGLEVVPDPILPSDPGHVYLPGIKYEEFVGSSEGRQRILDIIGKLLDHAAERILITPGTPNPPAPTPSSSS